MPQPIRAKQAVTGSAVSTGTTNAEGSSNAFARADHSHRVTGLSTSDDIGLTYGAIADFPVGGLLRRVSGTIVGSDIEVIDTTEGPSLTAMVSASFASLLDNGNSGATPSIDWTHAQKQRITLSTASVSPSFISPAGPANVVLLVQQDVTGNRTITWPASVRWAGGTAPTLSTAPNAIDLISLFYDGTNYYGAAALNFS